MISREDYLWGQDLPVGTSVVGTAVHRVFRPVQLTAQKDAAFQQRQPLGAVARVSQVGHPDAGTTELENAEGSPGELQEPS